LQMLTDVLSAIRTQNARDWDGSFAGNVSPSARTLSSAVPIYMAAVTAREN